MDFQGPFLFSLLVLLLAGCRKEGIDGDAALKVELHHHSRNIYSCCIPNYHDSIFIKFGAKEIPADPTRDYDALFVGDSGTCVVSCTNLKWGYYSVFATGWDTVMNTRVSGGMTTKISHSERKKEQDLTVLLDE